MFRELSLVTIAERFFRYFNIVNEFLLSHRYMLSGLGVHPYRKSMGVNMLDNARYRMMYEFTKYSGNHPGLYPYPGYLSFICSIHTHIDADLADVPGLLNFLSKLDWVKALLFSNSGRICEGEIEMINNSPICWRDELMGNSLITAPEKGFGPYETHFNQVADVCGEILEQPLWHVRRGDNDYIIFNPQKINTFVKEKIIHGNLCHGNGAVSATSFQPRVDDIQYLRSFRSVEVREMGTLESRSDCVQPVSESFAPTAFILGIVNNRKKIEKLFDPYSYQNTAMRKIAATNGAIPHFDEDSLKILLAEILNLAREGLTQRGYGEEFYLEPLYKRVDRLACPAKDNMALIKNGGTIEDLIHLNGAVKV
jgi:gamma-glutamylcysteine synthetase